MKSTNLSQSPRPRDLYDIFPFLISFEDVHRERIESLRGSWMFVDLPHPSCYPYYIWYVNRLLQAVLTMPALGRVARGLGSAKIDTLSGPVIQTVHWS